MVGSISEADLEYLEVVCLVERSPYWEILEGLEGRLGGPVGVVLDDLGLEDWRPPMVDMDLVDSFLSGPSSGPESSSKMVFRFAGGGRWPNGGFFVILTPYDNLDMIVK